MRGLIIICVLLLLFSSCTVINERYTEKRIRVEPDVYYDDTPDYEDSLYSYYSPSYFYNPFIYYPYYWSGFGWWDPFWYWGFYGNNYWYYRNYWSPYFFYPSRYGTRYGRSIITKRQLQKRTSSRTIKSPKGIAIKGGSTGTIKSKGIRSTSTRSRPPSSSRGSSGKIKKRK